MTNKKNIFCLLLIASTFLFASYTLLKTSGSHPGSTGAPLEKTCAQKSCHNDASVISDTVGVNSFSFSSVDSSYIPGQTYSLTIQVQNAGITKFGFEVVGIKDADSTNAGQFTISDAARTQLINSIAPNGLRNSVTHQTAGTPALSNGLTQWSFNWTAPQVNEGDITFWYATNCTDNDGQSTGDIIYLNSFQIHPSNLISVKEIAEEYDLKTFYDPEHKEIIINYDLKGLRTVKVIIYDSGGELIYESATAKLSGKQKEKIQINNKIVGAYLVQLNFDTQKATKKIIVY